MFRPFIPYLLPRRRTDEISRFELAVPKVEDIEREALNREIENRLLASTRLAESSPTTIELELPTRDILTNITPRSEIDTPGSIPSPPLLPPRTARRVSVPTQEPQTTPPEQVGKSLSFVKVPTRPSRTDDIGVRQGNKIDRALANTRPRSTKTTPVTTADPIASLSADDINQINLLMGGKPNTSLPPRRFAATPLPREEQEHIADGKSRYSVAKPITKAEKRSRTVPDLLNATVQVALSPNTPLGQAADLAAAGAEKVAGNIYGDTRPERYVGGAELARAGIRGLGKFVGRPDLGEESSSLAGAYLENFGEMLPGGLAPIPIGKLGAVRSIASPFVRGAVTGGITGIGTQGLREIVSGNAIEDPLEATKRTALSGAKQALAFSAGDIVRPGASGLGYLGRGLTRLGIDTGVGAGLDIGDRYVSGQTPEQIQSELPGILVSNAIPAVAPSLSRADLTSPRQVSQLESTAPIAQSLPPQQITRPRYETAEWLPKPEDFITREMEVRNTDPNQFNTNPNLALPMSRYGSTQESVPASSAELQIKPRENRLGSRAFKETGEVNTSQPLVSEQSKTSLQEQSAQINPSRPRLEAPAAPRSQELLPPRSMPQAEAMPAAQEFKPIAEGKTSDAVTARGTKVRTRFTIMEADQPIASHDTGLRPNPEYPASLQPRDRSSKASEEQISGEKGIVTKFEPSFLGDSPQASSGAPILGPDRVVESGNGRIISLRRIYANEPAKAEAYRQFLMDNAEQFGLSREQIAQTKNPILVRVREGDMSDTGRIRFAEEANERDIAEMSAIERAKVDARKLNTAMLENLEPSETGDLLAGSNRKFLAAFANQVISPQEKGRYVKNGELTQEGLTRVRNAVFARAYGDTPDGINVLSKAVESTDVNVKNAVAAMVKLAPRFASLKKAINAGARNQLDISADIATAVNKLAELRSRKTLVGDFLKQENLFGQDLTPFQKKILEIIAPSNTSAKKINAILGNYLDG
ncbi:MAG: hypothetical protein AB1489_35955, partial [Acidobacteriota bacterium]